MPLDNRLRWIGLEDDERRRLLEALGADRLGRWLGALSSPALDADRHRLRRSARRLAIAGLLLWAVGGTAAWFAFTERDRGEGELVELSRGDEAPQGRAVRLRGVRHSELAAKTTRTDRTAAHLEVWAPMTSREWKPGQPVTWIVADPTMGMSKSGAATWSGTVSDEPLPERATTELAKVGVVLAPTVRVLTVLWQPPDPLHLPAILVFAFCGALGLALLIGALGSRVRAGRIDAIL